MSTQEGSLTASVDWNDVAGADSYTVRWREGVKGTQLNQGTSVTTSNASITVADYGEWVVKVFACKGDNCGPGKSTRFQVLQPNRAPAVNQDADNYDKFVNSHNAPRGVWVHKSFEGIFTDPDGDELTYAVSVTSDNGDLVEMLLIAREQVSFRADTADDWHAIRPPLPDTPVVTVTLTATDPEGLSASVNGNFLTHWENQPVPVRAESNGESIALTFNQGVRGVPAPGQFTVNVVNGYDSAGTIGVNSVSVSGAVVTLELASAIQDGQTATLDYAHDADAPLQRAGGDAHAPDFTGQVVEVTREPPGPVENLEVSAEPGALNLLATWQEVKRATSYNLRWRQESDAGFQPANKTTVTASTAVFSVAELGTWVVQVEACNYAGCGSAGTIPTVVSADSLPLVPSITPVCDRTPAVRDLLVERVRKECADITAADLAGETRGIIRWEWEGLSSLKSGDFDGLYNIDELSLGNDHRFTTLPEDIFDDLYSLQELDLSVHYGYYGGSSQLAALPENVFDSLTGLRRLDLKGNDKLRTLPEDVFNGTPNLQTLDLEYTGLTALPEGVFAGLSSLQELNLSDLYEENHPTRTGLTALPEGLFNGLSSLQTLDLEDNSLAALPEDLFDGLSNLQTLGLNSNHNLAALPADVFDGLSSLQELNLGATPV